jgi:hypothetical protein
VELGEKSFQQSNTFAIPLDLRDQNRSRRRFEAFVAARYPLPCTASVQIPVTLQRVPELTLDTCPEIHPRTPVAREALAATHLARHYKNTAHQGPRELLRIQNRTWVQNASQKPLRRRRRLCSSEFRFLIEPSTIHIRIRCSNLSGRNYIRMQHTFGQPSFSQCFSSWHGLCF